MVDVSIVIPTFNRKGVINRTIDSAIAQDYTNYEIILIDNASEDGTWEVLQEYAENHKIISAYRNKTNIGPVQNWIAGVEQAKGNFVKILFSDDALSPEAISKSVALFDDDTAFVIMNYDIVDIETGNVRKSIRFNNISETTLEYICDVILNPRGNRPVSPSAGLFRTSDFLRYIERDMDGYYGLIYSNTGAGVDLSVFINTAVNYPNRLVKYANTTVIFGHHSNSISVASNLVPYYATMKMQFARDNFARLVPRFKAVLLIQALCDHRYRQTPVLGLILYGYPVISIYWFFKLLSNKLKNFIKNKRQ